LVDALAMDKLPIIATVEAQPRSPPKRQLADSSALVALEQDIGKDGAESILREGNTCLPLGVSNKEQPAVGARDTAVLLQLTKTKMCAFFERGKCASSTCRYAHTVDELRRPPNLQKTKLCRAFLQSVCRAGENCGFAHGENDLRVTEGIYKTQMCNFYERGYCKKGDRCNHAHGVVDLRPPASQVSSGAAVATILSPVAGTRRTPAGTVGAPGSAEKLQRPRRNPLPLAELLADLEGQSGASGHSLLAAATVVGAGPRATTSPLAAAPTPTKSVAELASLAISPMPASPLWTQYRAQPLSPAAALAATAGEPAPWPRDPLGVLLDHRSTAQRATPSPVPLQQQQPPQQQLRQQHHPVLPFETTPCATDRCNPASAVTPQTSYGATPQSWEDVGMWAREYAHENLNSDVVAMDLSERLASLDVVVRELAADVAGLRRTSGSDSTVPKPSRPNLHRI